VNSTRLDEEADPLRYKNGIVFEFKGIDQRRLVRCTRLGPPLAVSGHELTDITADLVSALVDAHDKGESSANSKRWASPTIGTEGEEMLGPSENGVRRTFKAGRLRRLGADLRTPRGLSGDRRSPGLR
jgi:hypothetical protein